VCIKFHTNGFYIFNYFLLVEVFSAVKVVLKGELQPLKRRKAPIRKKVNTSLFGIPLPWFYLVKYNHSILMSYAAVANN
jgi:hypothetical protein